MCDRLMNDQDSFTNPEPPSSLTQDDFRKLFYQQSAPITNHKQPIVKQKTFEEIKAEVGLLVSTKTPISTVSTISKTSTRIGQKIIDVLEKQTQTDSNIVDLFIPGKSVFSFPDNINDSIILKTKKLVDYKKEASQHIMMQLFIEKLSNVMKSTRSGTHSSQQKKEYSEEDIYSNLGEYVFDPNASTKKTSNSLFTSTIETDELATYKRQIIEDCEVDIEEIKKKKSEFDDQA